MVMIVNENTNTKMTLILLSTKAAMPQQESSVWHNNFLVWFLPILECYNTGNVSEHHVVKLAEIKTMATCYML